MRTEEYKKLIEKSRYFCTLLHRNDCFICDLDKSFKNSINTMIFRNTPMHIIIDEIKKYYPNESNDQELQNNVSNHKKYIHMILENISTREMYRDIKEEHKIPACKYISNKDKSKFVSLIEEEIDKDNDSLNFDNSKITIMNQMYKETLPQLLLRLNHEITKGSTKGIKEISTALQYIWKIIDDVELNDTIEVNDTIEANDTNDKILSLADKIKQATEKRKESNG